MTSNTLDNAVAEEIGKVKKGQLTKKADDDAKITALFNIASGLLETLRDFQAKHPEVHFKETATPGKLTIYTNIQVYETGPEVSEFAALTITVSAKGKIVASGDGGTLIKERARTKVSKPDANEKILRFVAKYAAKRGMISAEPDPEPAPAPEPAAPAAKAAPTPLEISDEVSKAIRVLNNPVPRL